MALVLTLLPFWKTLRCNMTLHFSEMTDHAMLCRYLIDNKFISIYEKDIRF